MMHGEKSTNRDIHKRCLPVELEPVDQSDHGRILGRDAVRNRGGDADDFLQHADVSIEGVVSRLDLTGFHAKGGVEVHTCGSGRWKPELVKMRRKRLGLEMGFFD